MQWEVTGADRATGEERTLTIEADDEGSAGRRGNRRGLMVSSVRPLDPMDSVADSPVVAPVQVAAQPAEPAVASNDLVGFAYSPPPVAGYGGYSPSPTRRSAPPKGVSGLGVAALIIGILAALICWVPLIGLLAIPFAVIGTVLAAVGVLVSLAGKRSGIGMPLAGGVVCLLAIGVAVLMTGAVAATLQKAGQQAAAQARLQQSHQAASGRTQIAAAPSAAPAADDQPAAAAPTPPTTTPPPEPTVSISATALLATYSSNEIAADASYKGNVIAVTGEVENVGKDILGTMYVTLKGSDPMSFRHVQCMFDRDSGALLAQVQKGLTYKIIGTCHGMMGNVLVEDCRFSK